MFKTLKSYPRGLIPLSTIEMWERYSFYTMQGLLALYAIAKVSNGGLGWNTSDALKLTGYYGALIYVSPVLGGWVADRLIGTKKAVLLGSIIMLAGHISLAYHNNAALYLGLALLITGCGLLKPSISAMVGELYKNHKFEDGSRDAGFALFYMAINIGSVFGPLIGGVISQLYGYSIGFLSAAVALIISIINLLSFRNRSLKGIGETISTPNIVNRRFSAFEKRQVFTYCTLCVSNIFWNVIYALPYGLLMIYAEKNIDRHLFGVQIPATWYYALYGILIVLASPILATIYNFIKEDLHKRFPLSYKLGIAYSLLALACFCLLPMVTNISHNPNYVGNSWNLIGFYVLFAVSELLTIPVLLSAATKFAPEGYSARLVSFNMVVSWAIGAWLGGEFGALTQQIDAVKIFNWTIWLCVVFAAGHFITNKIVVKYETLD